jgi:hypothetical protein
VAQKKLQKNSRFEEYDMDGDGVVTDEELDMEKRMIRGKMLKETWHGLLCLGCYFILQV